MRIFWICLLTVLNCYQAYADTWPSRPIKLIVSQAAGSPPDIACRIIAERLADALGAAVIVENRPGNGNIIGAQAAARSAPDGYTFFFATAAALVSNPYTYKTLPYDPARAFTPVSMVAKGPFLILAHPNAPVKTLDEVFAYERANPEKLAVATDGARNFSGMLVSWLNKLAGTDLRQIPYPNISQGAQDAVAGHVQMVILAIPTAAPFLMSGQLRALAVSSAKPMPNFETIAPIARTFPGIDLVGWFAFVAPAATSSEIVLRVNRELDKILKNPAISNRLVELGLYTEGAGTPEETATFIRAQYELWGKVTREIGLDPQ